MPLWIKSVVVCSIGITIVSQSYALQLSEILKNPRRFDAQSVSLTGVADVEGDQFILYENAEAALKTELNHAIFVRQPVSTVNLDRLRGRWVKVIGILDAERHGPRGIGFACDVLLQHVSLAGGRLVRLPVGVLGRFRNETGTDVHVKLFDNHSGLYAEFDVPRQGFNGLAVKSGQVIVTTLGGSAVTKGDILVNVEPRLTLTGETAILYFRITTHGVESVAPNVGKKW